MFVRTIVPANTQNPLWLRGHPRQCRNVIPKNLMSGAIVLRKIKGRVDACRQMLGGYTTASPDRPDLFVACLAFLAILVGLVLHPSASADTSLLHYLPLLIGATGYSNTAASTVSNMADLYQKQNTDVKTAIKLVTEEQKWFRSYPKENIVVSGNENRIPLILTKPIHPSFIPDGGKERIMATPNPTHGTFMPVQMNVRFGYTGLAQALTARARAAMIEDQTTYQANMAGYSIGLGLGTSTYGTSVGTQAVVKTTNSAGTTQVLALKNAYGSSTFVAGGDTGAQDTYLSNIFNVGDHIALVRAGTIVEFAAITASPSATSGIGFIDATFTASATPTVGDLIVFANADGDSTITGTDYNNSALGFTDILLNDSVEGQTTTSFPKWAAGSTSSTAQRASFVVKEKMINDCWNAGGVTINRFIMAQGVRRDIIAGELGARRYNSSETDIEGDLNAGSGQQYFTSQLALPNTMIGYYDKAVSKIELSDNPDDAASKSIFKLDKVQGVSAIAAGYDFFFNRICSSRAACGYATALTAQ